jgi:hypothetical protein
VSRALTDLEVESLLRSLRGNRQLEYLCRAYLQFGPSVMDDADLAKLTKAVARRGARP